MLIAVRRFCLFVAAAAFLMTCLYGAIVMQRRVREQPHATGVGGAAELMIVPMASFGAGLFLTERLLETYQKR